MMTRNNVYTIFLSLLMVLSVVAVGATPAAAQAEGEVNVVLEPTNQEVQPGNTVQYDVVVEGNDASFSTYQATVAIDDTAVGEITAFDDANAGGFGDSTIANDGSSVFFSRTLGNSEITASSVTIGTVTVTAADSEGTTSLSVTDPGGDETTEIGAYNLNTLGSADLTVAEGDAGNDPAGEVDVVLEPTEQEVQPGDQTTYDVVVEGNDANFSSYQATVETGDANVGEITGFDDANAGGFGDVTIADDGSSVFFSRSLGNSELTDSAVTLGTVTVTAADSEGTTTLSVVDLGGDQATEIGDYNLNTLGSADLTVAEQQFPDLVGEGGPPARDLDGDGFPEDVDGSGSFGIGDIQELFEYFIQQRQ